MAPINPSAGHLVRSYSLELETTLPQTTPTTSLQHIFLENERRLRHVSAAQKSWREYYEPWNPTDKNTYPSSYSPHSDHVLTPPSDPTSKILREKAVLLSHAWKVFRTTLPNEEQEELEGQVPSVSGLVGMVMSVSTAWNEKRGSSKRGKFMKCFTAFSQTLEAHSYMLEVLPVGNEYVSLFTGVLKTLINVRSLFLIRDFLS